MSAKIFSWAFKQDCPSSAAKLVLLKLADHSDARGYSWPGVPRIVRETGLCERTVRKCLHLLEQAGLVQIERRVQGKRQTTNGYYLTIGPVDRSVRRTNPSGLQMLGSVEAGAGRSGNNCTPNITPTEPPDNLPAAEVRGEDIPDTNTRIGILRQEIGEAEFKAWFEGAVFRNIPPVSITLQTPFRTCHVRSKYLATLQRLFGQEVMVQQTQLLAPPPTHQEGIQMTSSLGAELSCE